MRTTRTDFLRLADMAFSFNLYTTGRRFLHRAEIMRRKEHFS